ncbi:MAG: hypothetical protein DRJ05_06265, partial [Bacteroidetes bacterium]
MFKNYFKITFRNLWKNKVFSLLNTIGLAIALAVALIIFLFINNELSTDNFQKNKDNIYLVSTMDYYTTPPVLIKSLGDDIPGLESKLRLFMNTLVTGEESNKMKFRTYFADSSFFNILSFKLLLGDRANVLKEKGHIVLTETLAIKTFGTIDVVGKTIDLSRENSTKTHTYLITGIMEDVPDNSSMSFDVVTNFHSLENLFGNGFEDDFSEWSYISLLMINENTNLENFQKVFDKRLINFFMENNEDATESDFVDEEISELIPFSSLYFDRPDIQVFRQGNKNFI